jgi:hypothetical protein
MTIEKRRQLAWEAGARGDNGLYALSVPMSAEKPTSQMIARRLQWSLDGTLSITCDNKAYGPETWASKPAKCPVIQGPAIWRGGFINAA